MLDTTDFLPLWLGPGCLRGVKSLPSNVRLSDVAALAKVSVSTASRALTGTPGASPSTVAAVLTAAEKLGYRPNPIARAMRVGTTGLLGIIVPGIANPFFAEIVEALDIALGDRGLEMVLADSRGQSELEGQRIKTLLDRKVDGLILVPADHRESSTAVLDAQRHVSVVQIDRRIDGVNGDYVGVDDAVGIQLLLDHVTDIGSRNIAFVSSEPTSSTARSRLSAFEFELSQRPQLQATEPILGDFTAAFGRAAADQLLARGTLPETIVCGADVIALGVVHAFRANGISVPEDVTVTGFDGIVLAQLMSPRLTTVKQPVETIAREAVGLIWSRLSGDASPARRSVIAPILQVGGSTIRTPSHVDVPRTVVPA
jgi:LacI family transcriptional regulator